MKVIELLAIAALISACSTKAKPVPEPSESSGDASVPTAAEPDVVEPQPDPPEPPPPKGLELIDQARALFRVAACGGDGAIPEGLRREFVDVHCNSMAKKIAGYTNGWMSKAGPFFDELVPTDLPKTVVYPFGGGDLLTALVVFRRLDLDEITTISLEPAGDPRGISELTQPVLEAQLNTIRREIGNLFGMSYSVTKNMINFMRNGKLPAHLMFSLMALSVHGYEPVSLRYFELEPDGAIRYLEDDDIAALTIEAHDWLRRNQAFSNVELQFRRVGDAVAKTYVFRHVRANLDDRNLAADDRVIKHLTAKGEVTVMTKAASFLLWWRDFSTIRQYLLDNMVWMVSDATGIPPRYAGPAGFEQITWGKFYGPILSPGSSKGLIELWHTNPHQPLDFRFGYYDKANHNHLMVTRRSK
jgi:hypothetical protein